MTTVLWISPLPSIGLLGEMAEESLSECRLKALKSSGFLCRKVECQHQLLAASPPLALEPRRGDGVASGLAGRVALVLFSPKRALMAPRRVAASCSMSASTASARAWSSGLERFDSIH